MIRPLLPVLAAMALGIGAGECLTTSFTFRHWLGHVVRRGELETLVERRGIYDTDIERVWRAELFAAGATPEEIEEPAAREGKRAALQRLISQAKLDAAAAGQSIDPSPTRREVDLLRWQFPDAKTWSTSLKNSATTLRGLEREVRTDLRDRAWLDGQIAPQLQPNETEARRYFDEHRPDFQEPLRLRVSHLFLAAPEGYPAEVIEAKRALVADLAKRLANGESFPALVAEFSEDEATKKRGGDLGYFAEERMLPAVFAAARQLRPGDISAPVRSRLGFHILRLAESRPPRALTLEEARPEINAQLENQKRVEAVAGMVAALQ
jgi:hypothetical protein